MKIEKKHWIIIAVVIILIALWYFFFNKKDNESAYRNKSKDRNKTKVCSCTYLGKPNKICSHDVNCNLCCEGAGTSGQEFISNVLNDSQIK